MNQLREMMHDLINQTYEALKVVMHVNTSKFFFISWLSLRDDFIRQNIEYNFTQNQRNKWSIETFTWLFDHLIDLRIFQHKSIMMNAHKIKKWFEKIDRFHELLIILMQWVWSQNARDLEFLSMCDWSSDETQRHNMFIVVEYDSDESQKNQMKLVIRYHKNYNINEIIKMIHRFLSYEMNVLFI